MIGFLYRFQKTYFPWLNIPDSDIQDPIWVLAQCAVASRHLDDDTALPNVERRLRKAAEDATFSQVFSSCPSIAAIQSLLVLSIWPLSRDVPLEEMKDNRMQLASAIAMAKSRGLGHAFENRLVSALVGSNTTAYIFVLLVDITGKLGLCVSSLRHNVNTHTHCDI